VDASDYQALGPPRDVEITSVDVRGIADPALAETLRGVIQTKPAGRLISAPIAEDLRRLWGLGTISDARVDIEGTAGGVAVTFVLAPQPLIDRVTIVGTRDDALELRRLRWLAGTPYEPERIARVAAAIQDAYIHDGHLDARVEARRITQPGVAVCVAVEPGPRVTIGAVRFIGRAALPERKLVGLIGSDESAVNRVGGLYDPRALDGDLEKIAAAYYETGHIQVHLDPPRTTRRGDKLEITIAIDEGPAFHVGRVALAIYGGDKLPLGLRTGALFVRSNVSAEVSRLEDVLGPGASVYPILTLDASTSRVDVTFHVDWRWPWHVLHWLSSR
jgi:outer membrane protein insertion porin family